ncbi:MAG: hypothetical protein CVT89_05325 [Candidatus Altiarchaeales archaeon HGW-Altiarchaeales-2]|nr:MAG: hypothetical protein CVT89_05325 [Candidatus Altiarchaeales archaeon HGW-Altiarchaeales-2]
MARKPKVVKHIDYNTLKDLYLKEKDARVKERLLAMLELYDRKSLSDTGKIVKRSKPTIERWLQQWNKNGYKGGMTIISVIAYIQAIYEITYSYSGAWRVIRKIKKIPYGKPFIQNEKRPENAEELLKKNFFRSPLY